MLRDAPEGRLPMFRDALSKAALTLVAPHSVSQVSIQVPCAAVCLNLTTGPCLQPAKVPCPAVRSTTTVCSCRSPNFRSTGPLSRCVLCSHQSSVCRSPVPLCALVAPQHFPSFVAGPLSRCVL